VLTVVKSFSLLPCISLLVSGRCGDSSSGLLPSPVRPPACTHGGVQTES
jgi:hypothetical protein